ncbi:MAG: LPS export ABC transporter periplasmic protein LptC [Flavobacteriales bacterium]|nr:LPS export ABC transporter periplasmic protein LptC [Flavobacteriales bacterium]
MLPSPRTAWSSPRSASMRSALLTTFVLTSILSPGQEAARIEVLNADVWKFEEEVAPGVQRLQGNVRFRHEDAVMQCDSAWLYQERTVKAYGHIRIVQGDTLTITGERLDYDGKERTATLDGDVVMVDPGTTLRTPALVYDLRNKSATYSGGGTIVSHAEGDTLTSRVGTYLSDARRFVFSRDVVLRHPERTITSDTLHYHTATGVAEFFGPTSITQKTSRIECVRGTYDTRTRKADFTQRARVITDGQELEGDSVHYDGEVGVGLAWGHVVATDTANGTTVLGDHGRYDQRSERSYVTGHAELLMRSASDTLFMHADSLFAAPDTAGGARRITARQSVRFFKKDLQGVCDTLIYAETDSMIRMFHEPVLWSGKDQITGDHIRIALVDGHVHRLYADGNAFMTSLVDSIHFDQVVGTTMTGFFVNNELDHLITEGNARTVYYAQETQDSVKRIVGVNRADCSRILVRVADGEVSSVSFLTQPDAVLYPLEKAPTEELMLPGFTWRQQERPIDRADIQRKVPTPGLPLWKDP